MGGGRVVSAKVFLSWMRLNFIEVAPLWKQLFRNAAANTRIR